MPSAFTLITSWKATLFLVQASSAGTVFIAMHQRAAPAITEVEIKKDRFIGLLYPLRGPNHSLSRETVQPLSGPRPP